MSRLLEVCDIKKYFYARRGIRQLFFPSVNVVKAVDGVSFSIDKAKTLVIAGESGSGKTTVARIIMRAIEPDSGSILFEGEDIARKKGNDLKRFRSQVQMVIQDPYTSLNPNIKVMESIREPLTIHDKTSTKKEHMEKVLKALESVRLEPAADIADKYPHMLSGGQRQRVALARSIVTRPKLIIADEPVSMLDVSVRAEILELMKNLRDKLNISYIYITHDLATARYVGDDIVIMYAGKIVESGTIDQVLLNPLHPYTQALIDAISEPDPGNIQKEKVIRIKKGEDFFAQQQGCRFYNRCPYSMEKCRVDPALKQYNSSQKVSCFIYHQN